MWLINMNCFGKYNYQREECLVCPHKIECMLEKYKEANETEWFDSAERPNCYGSYKGKDCNHCPFSKECSRMSVDFKREFLRKGKKQRISGKYKERGSWKERDYY